MNPPPPIIVDGVPELEVEKILDSRWYKDGLQYLVKWQGQPNEESTWEWAEEVKRNAKESVDDYHRANPDAPRPLTITIPPPKKQVRILTRKKEELPRKRLPDHDTEILLHALRHRNRALLARVAPLLLDRDVLPLLPDHYVIPW
ncbi:hypothetical protein H0H81_007139, partial [Sphagnurus paluster]